MAGTGNVCFHNSLELAKLGHDVTVFTSRYPDEDFKYPDLLKVVRFKPCFRIGNAPFLPKLIVLGKFDIVHLHYPFVFGAELVLLNSLLRKNTLVITYHQDLIFGGILGYLVRIYNIIVRDQVLSKAKRILTPTLDHFASSEVKQLLARRETDVIELPNGVDPEHFNPGVSNRELREKYRIRDDENVVLFVGALDKAHIVKGVDVLLNAFRKLQSAGKVSLLIVGDGDLRHQYEKLARDLAISDRVTFTGTILNWELPAYYALSDLVVLPSTSVEMFGMVLVEAMACGKPVIGTTLPGLRTVVDDGKNGLLAEPGNVEDLTAKMQYLLDNEPVRKRFGAQGRKKAEDRYSWPKIGKTLEQVYIEVLSEF
jgi:glycosyltransferase involved in cell wall biosynthesis